MQRFQFLKLAAAAVIAVPLLLSGCGDKKTAELKVGPADIIPASSATGAGKDLILSAIQDVLTKKTL